MKRRDFLRRAVAGLALGLTSNYALGGVPKWLRPKPKKQAHAVVMQYSLGDDGAKPGTLQVFSGEFLSGEGDAKLLATIDMPDPPLPPAEVAELSRTLAEKGTTGRIDLSVPIELGPMEVVEEKVLDSGWLRKIGTAPVTNVRVDVP